MSQETINILLNIYAIGWIPSALCAYYLAYKEISENDKADMANISAGLVVLIILSWYTPYYTLKCLYKNHKSNGTNTNK